jgi:long-chain fatty acid transport protein
MHKPLRTLVSAAVIGIMATGAAHAGAFSLYTESSPAATGNFGAGIAAEGGDAAIGWYNPAGLVLIRNQQAVFGGVGVFPTAKISGTSRMHAPTPFGLPDYVQSFNGIEGAVDAFVPSFHYALPIGENATVGLSAVSPFGLSTDWGILSPVRYQATFSELLTTNISPEIGGKLSENFSIGAGLDLQYARVKFNRILGFPTLYGNIVPPFNPMGVDSLSYNKGNSYGVGFHAGVLAMFNDKHSRIGLNYQSKVKHTFHGYSTLSGPLANNGGDVFTPSTLSDTAFATSSALSSTPTNFPDVVTLSGYHDWNEKLALLGSVVWTGWSTFNVIQLNNVEAPLVGPNGGLPTGQIQLRQVNSVSPQNYRDAWRFAVGANYHVNPLIMLRVGGGYDGTPTNDIDRDVRLPDASRWALSIGGHYQARPNIGLDVGYTHLFPADKPNLNRTDSLGEPNFYNVTATATAGADLLGAQLVWIIDKADEAPTK